MKRKIRRTFAGGKRRGEESGLAELFMRAIKSWQHERE